jgi:uncharacterized protein (UPF0335 family)
MSDSQEVAGDELRAFIERIETVEGAMADYATDKAEIYSEAKGRGFDVKVIKEIVKFRKQDPNERYEKQTILDLYLGALGMMI